MGPSHSLSSIDSGDAILGPGRLLLRLWEAAGYGTLPLAWPGPQTKLVSQILLLRNLDFRHSCPRLFLMVLDWVMESYGLSFSTVSRNAEKTRLQRKPVCREREMWGEKRGGRDSENDLPYFQMISSLWLSPLLRPDYTILIALRFQEKPLGAPIWFMCRVNGH